MPRPEAVRWRERNLGLDFSLRSRGVAQATTKRSAAVFKVTDRMPSVANWRKTWPRSGAMNCGMKERKKRAVLGLRASVRTPCLKAAATAGRKAKGAAVRKVLVAGDEFCVAASSGSGMLRERIIFMPRKIR